MAKLRKTNEEYVKELREKNPEIIPLEEYRGNTKEILHKHIPCGYEWNVPLNAYFVAMDVQNVVVI